MNKIYESENLFLKELDKSSARQVLDYYMRNKAFLEEWEIIRNEEFYTLNFHYIPLLFKHLSFQKIYWRYYLF